MEGSGEAVDSTAEAYLSFLNGLYDEEFDEALFELFDEASVLYQNRSLPELEAERMLEQHLAPLVAEVETMLEALAGELGPRDPASLSEGEIEALVDGYTPGAELSPSFESFLGGLKNLVKKAVKGAASLAKKGLQAVGRLGLGPVFNKLKALIKPLLKRVLQAAIARLPTKLQPIAQKLAERLPFLKELEEDSQQESDAASLDVTELQHEFNRQIASLVFAPGELEQVLELTQVTAAAQSPREATLTELELARERFMTQLGQLKEGEDPTPYVESFLPAILPALRLGMRLIGRKREVDFLAKLMGKLIRRFIGPQNAPALYQAMVDIGLRLMGHVTPEDEARAASTAVAATVEDTVWRVAALPDHVLEDPDLLEGFALEAFEQAAAANLPPILPEAVYRERPDLLAANGVRGCWLMRRRYKKFSRVFRTTVTPHRAMAVQTFGGATLAEFLQEQLGLPPGDQVQAEVHLYESLPGTTLPELARLEAAVAPELAGGGEHATAQLHPLTPDAAGVLLGEPRLGRPASAKALGSRRTVEVRQRLYHLAIPGRRPLLVPEPGGRARVRRPGGLQITFDFPADQIRVHVFMGEARAQKLAVKLRQQSHLGAAVASLRGLLERGLRTALSGLVRGRVKIVHEALTPEQALGEGLRRLPPVLSEALARKLQQWLVEGLTDLLKQDAQRVIAATEDAKDGVTLVFTLGNPPGIAILRQALKGKMPLLSALSLPSGTPSVKVDVIPGYAHD